MSRILTIPRLPMAAKAIAGAIELALIIAASAAILAFAAVGYAVTPAGIVLFDGKQLFFIIAALLLMVLATFKLLPRLGGWLATLLRRVAPPSLGILNNVLVATAIAVVLYIAFAPHA